ncbi:FolC bifunctional protein [Mytilinidion resinicola]|uniref:FolC bifunctional protein n=1 Tax=Mytilinidion resinicola TaxID=574789 RepID=A0A6A6YL45_9PEZI|nr:FolC bifunctional protein [Mytilinidion resinicola]KAF2809269.1 FolC bifunctional protein [Mytilinidion resinicola]
MIQPGLERISLLLKHTQARTLHPWKAIHVAGTNGKGSICANASALLRRANVRCGRFTSPHLIDRWDCITIDDVPVKHKLFREVEDSYLQYNASEGIKASEFEILTATAFDIFGRENVQVGVVEVGMGGRQDATNVLQAPLVTVISKISLDHQSWLGNTIQEIAREKAGILKPGVPCVVDHTNDDAVKNVIEAVAKEVGAGPILYTNSIDNEMATFPGWGDIFDSILPHQRVNTISAYLAVRQTLESLGLPKLEATEVAPGLKDVVWPGRLQKLQLDPIIKTDTPILLDGAHNADSARVLGDCVNERFRQNSESLQEWADARSYPDASFVTWILAVTEGKDAEEILRPLLRPGDTVMTVEFGPIEGMPWVRPMDSYKLLQAARTVCDGIAVERSFGKELVAALLQANYFACHVDAHKLMPSPNRPIVIAGSLYLASDILRLQRDYDPTDEHVIKQRNGYKRFLSFQVPYESDEKDSESDYDPEGDSSPKRGASSRGRGRGRGGRGRGRGR